MVVFAGLVGSGSTTALSTGRGLRFRCRPSRASFGFGFGFATTGTRREVARGCGCTTAAATCGGAALGVTAGAGAGAGTGSTEGGLEGISAASDSRVSAAGEAVTGSNRLIRSAATLAIITTARAAAATPIQSGTPGRLGRVGGATAGVRGARRAGAARDREVQLDLEQAGLADRPRAPRRRGVVRPRSIRSTVGQYQPASGWVSSPTRYPSIRASMPHQPACAPDQSGAGSSSTSTWLGGPPAGGAYQRQRVLVVGRAGEHHPGLGVEQLQSGGRAGACRPMGAPGG